MIIIYVFFKTCKTYYSVCFAAATTSGLALLLLPHGVDLILAWRTGHGAGKIVEGFKEHKMAGTVSQRRLEHV